MVKELITGHQDQGIHCNKEEHNKVTSNSCDQLPNQILSKFSAIRPTPYSKFPVMDITPRLYNFSRVWCTKYQEMLLVPKMAPFSSNLSHLEIQMYEIMFARQNLEIPLVFTLDY